MATSIMVPVEEYLRTSYQPDCDWVDGQVRERNMGEGPHSAVQKFFIVFFASREVELGVRVWPEHRVQVAATRFRVPDVCLTRGDEPMRRIIRTPPVLCIEILSPEDRMGAMQEKIDDYVTMGVNAVWVVDPWRRMAYQTDGRSLQPVSELMVPQTQIMLITEQVFAGLDVLEDDHS